MIEVKNVSKSYGTIEAVKNISFSVKEGETVGFLGPNGAGKSTTMRMITGSVPVSSGEILIDGRSSLSETIKTRKKIGYLPETAPIYMFFTVLEFLNFVADLKKVKKKHMKERVKYALNRCGLEDVKDRLISHLSKGYKQRVGIAQAIIHNPKILILDEPTVGLDPKQIIEVRGMIRELKADHTIILSSHILPEVSATCDRVVIINKGKIAIETSTQNIEAKMRDVSEIYLETEKKLTPDMVQEFTKIKGVDTASIVGRGVLLRAGKSKSIRSEVSAFAVGKNWGLLEICQRKTTLEDVFMSVVNREREVESA